MVTGATGLLGRQVVLRLLQEDYDLTGLARQTNDIPAELKNGHWLIGDLEHWEDMDEAIAAVDVVIHCAAKVGFSSHRSQEIMAFNIEATEQLVNSCLRYNTRLIHVSSVATLGDEQKAIITEDSPFNVQGKSTAYARSKYYSEMEVWRGISEGLDALIINPSIIIGIPAKWNQSSGSFWLQVNKGLPVFPTGSSGFVDARDVAEVIAQLIPLDISGQRFIVSGHNKSYHDFFSAIAQSLDKNPPKIALNSWMVSLYTVLTKFLGLFQLAQPISQSTFKTIQSQHRFSNQKLLDHISFRFRPFEESIQWVSDAFLTTSDVSQL